MPQLIDKINIAGKVVTADAMSMQKDIVDRIREQGGDFLIELKANQRSLRYGVEDRLEGLTPVYTYTEGPELGHGRIEARTYRVYDGLEVIADKEKWGGNMTIIEYEADSVRKSTGRIPPKKAVCEQSANRYAGSRGIRARPLVDREHALGAGCKSPARQDQT